MENTEGAHFRAIFQTLTHSFSGVHGNKHLEGEAHSPTNAFFFLT